MSDTQLRRRSFLSMMGTGAPLGSIILAAPGLDQALQPRAASAAIGVVLPRTGFKTSRWTAVREGLALGMRAHGRPLLDIMIEESDTHQEGVADVVGKLRARNVCAVIGCLDARLSQTAVRTCAGAVPFIDCGAGALVATTERAERGYLECSLAHWQNAYAAGRWAGGIARRAAMVSTLFEAGYDALYAFRLGFEEAGGEIIRTLVTDVPGREMSPHMLADLLQADRPEAIYLALHDHQGPLVTQAIAASPMAQDSVLIANEFMADQWSGQPLPAQGLMACTTYDAALSSPENAAFTAAYRHATGRQPDQCAVLGYEIGLLAQALRSGPLRSPLLLASPRGAVRIDPAIGLADVPHYLCRLKPHHHGVERQVLERLPTIDESDARIVALQRSIRSGWINPYLLQ